MLSIYSQQLQKKHYISIFTRGFIISSLCYITAFILPILILISIGCTYLSYNQDSWNPTTKTFIKPTIKYQNHQIFCLLKNQSTLYDSSFNDDVGSYQSTLSVGIDENQYSLQVNVNFNVLACSVVTYNRVMVNNMNVLVTIPFNFYHQASLSTVSLNKIIQKGKLQINSISSLLQPQASFEQVSYPYFVSSQQPSLSSNFFSLSSNNLTAFITPGFSSSTYGNLSQFQFSGTYQIQSQYFIQYESLINNIRTAVPYFMYVWLPLFYFLVLPLIRWMMKNKIYVTKVQNVKNVKIN